MNKLDYADSKFRGKGNLNDIFNFLGDLESTHQDSSYDSDSSSDLKTTSVRLPNYLIDSLDAVLSFHKISRNDAFLYMVHDFISSAIVSYSLGQMNALRQDPADLQVIIDTCESLIEKISNDEEIRKSLSNISEAEMEKAMGVL